MTRDNVNAIDPTGTYRRPDWQYVKTRYNTFEFELQGFHTKLQEIEALRYYEDNVAIDPERKTTGLKVRVGLTAELIENIKAAMLVNKPVVRVKALRKHTKAGANADNREHYWQGVVEGLYGGHNAPNLISELCDAQLMGVGVFKSGYDKGLWGTKERKRKRGESVDDHVDRVTAYKKMWGHPTAAVVVHGLSSYFRPGVGARVDEFIEKSFKPRSTVYVNYGLSDAMFGGDAQMQSSSFSTVTGVPNNQNSTIPAGINTSDYVEVYEYWNPQCYQVYVNNHLVYEENGDPSVCYFLAPGRSSSSKDPDKYALSVAENLRHNEPVINKLLTEMLEATDLIVHRRNTLEVPEGYTSEFDEEDGTDGKPRPRTWTFKEEYAEALPPGSRLRDPFENVGAAFGAMPLVQTLMQIAAQHGVSPLFKGISPGAAGSGYRDNSLYTMAKSMFEYIIDSLQSCLTAYVIWQEWCLVHQIKQETWSGEYSLSPGDIEDFPAQITVELKPTIPQNLISEGEFWARQQQLGNVSRRFMREQGLGIEQPGEMEDEVDFEQLKELLKPLLYQDVIAATIGQPPIQEDGGSGLVGPDGTPVSSQQMMQRGGNAGANGAGRGIGREMGGYATQGQGKEPAQPPASLPDTAGVPR